MTIAKGTSPNALTATAVPINRALLPSTRPKKIRVVNEGPKTMSATVTGISATTEYRAPRPRSDTTPTSSPAATDLAIRDIMQEIIELVRAAKVRAVVGRVIDFDDIPAEIEAMANRETIGRTVAVLGA